MAQPCPRAPRSLWSGRQWPSCARGGAPRLARSELEGRGPVAAGEELIEKDHINSPNCTNRVSPRSGSGCQRFLPILGPQENNLNSMKVLLAAVWKGDWRALPVLPGASTLRTEEPGPSGSGGRKGSFHSIVLMQGSGAPRTITAPGSWVLGTGSTTCRANREQLRGA